MQRLPLATNSINLVHEIINTHHEQIIVPGLSVPPQKKSREYQKQNRGKTILICFHLNTQFLLTY